MNSSLNDLCALIANQGAEYAHEHTEIFLEITRGTTEKAISMKQVDKTFKIFSFLNWALVNRIWSYMKNTTLRTDLKGQIRKSIVLKTSYELSEDKSNEGVAFLASELDKEFREFGLAYNERVRGLAGLGVELYANTATSIVLEWLQEIFDLNYEEMDVVESQFNDRVGNIAKIEDSAREVNRKANQRERGFFKRIFGSLGLASWQSHEANRQ
jgi:hypothetical protein